MDAYFNLLESCRGRDKILRLCTFAAMTGAGSLRGESTRRLATIAGQIGEARTVMRLFEGLPMFRSVLRLGFGRNIDDSLVRLLTVISTWSIQCFYPCELLAWAGKYKLLPVTNVGRWSSASVATWAIFLVCNILKSLRKIPGIRNTKRKLKKQTLHDPLEGRSPGLEQNDVVDWSIRQLEFEEQTEYLSLAQNITDLINAVHWLPKGFLWAGKLPLSRSGLLGLISTAIMFYTVYRIPPKQ